MIKVNSIRVRNDQFINYTYLVIDVYTNDSVIIDPGWELHTIITYLDQSNSALRGILLTHHHQDHTYSAPELARRYDVPVFMSAIEKSFYNFSCPNLNIILSDHPFSVGSFEVLPYHTPGHTKGGLCYQIRNSVFTGDTLFIEGCGICYGEDGARDMFNSLQKLKTNIDPSAIIYPGHCYGVRPGVTFATLLSQNIYCHLNEEDRFVAFRLRKNQRGLFNFR